MKNNERWQHLKFSASSVFGTADSWTLYQRIEGKSVILSGEKKVRAGRDSKERIKRFYPIERRKAQKINAGDRLEYKSEQWEVLLNWENEYLDIKAVQG